MSSARSATEAIRPYLGGAEALLWFGRPKQGLLLQWTDALSVPFAVLWTYIVWGMVTAGGPGVEGPPLVIPILFLGIGGYLLVGRFVLDAYVRARTWYGVTSQRALIVRTAPGTQIKSMPLPGAELSASFHRHGRGTITFGDDSSVWTARGLLHMAPALRPGFRFLAVDDVRSVLDILERPVGQR